MPEKNHLAKPHPEKIHIALMGNDDALADVLAEQAGAAGGFTFSYNDITAKPDVVFLSKDAPATDAPLAFHIIERDAVGLRDRNVFQKPFRLAALLDTAFTHAQLQRMKQPRALTADIIFHPFARMIEHKEQQISLTEKETQFLLALLNAGASGVTHTTAMTDIWRYHPDVDSHAADTTLYRLRQKLDTLPELVGALHNEGGTYMWGL
jgi:Transcriptional regulatory protein, C terminal